MDTVARKKSNKEKIMDAAVQIFAQKGFQEATISDISKKAGVADATIYEYFSGKEDLLFTISETITQSAIDLANQILPFMRDPVDKVRAHIQIAMTIYQQNPQYAAVGMLELKTNRRFHLSESYKTIQKSSRIFLETIKEGIEKGAFRKDIDPYLMRSMIFGTIEHLCIRKHLLNIPMDLTTYIDPIVELILNGAKTEGEEPRFSIHLQVTDGKIASNDKKGDMDQQDALARPAFK